MVSGIPHFKTQVTGVVSWGYLCGRTYGVYAKVSQFEDWIQTTAGLAPQMRGCHANVGAPPIVHPIQPVVEGRV